MDDKTPQQALDEAFDLLLAMTPKQLREYAKHARESGDCGDLYNCLRDNGYFERNKTTCL